MRTIQLCYILLVLLSTERSTAVAPANSTDDSPFHAYVCDNEASIGAQPDRTCFVTVTAQLFPVPVLFRSQQRVDRVKCLDCDIGALRAGWALWFSLAAHSVDLSGSHLQHIEPDSLSGTFRTLLLSYNALPALAGSRVFARTAQLRTLHVDHNALAYVDDRALDGIAGLRELWLNHNRLVVVTARTFAGLPQLERLRLHGNRLRTLDGDLLAGQPLLRELTLYDNRLVRVHDDVWTIIQRIGSFDIANVQQQLNANAPPFGPAERISTAEPDADADRRIAGDQPPDCRMSVRYQTPAQPGQLHNRSCGELIDVPTEFSGGGRIRYLNLRHNRIMRVEQWAFAAANGSAAQLLVVDLAHNHIENVAWNAFDGLRGVHELYLSHNFIRYLSVGQFGQLQALQVLELHRNHLHTVHEQQFWPNAALLRLTLHGNALRSSLGVRTFDQLQQLRHIDLSGNDIRTDGPLALNAFRVLIRRANLTGELQLDDRVMLLDAGENRIERLRLAGAFALEHLNCSDNRIGAVDLRRATLLKSVDLTGNRLSTVDLRANAELIAVHLAENLLETIDFGATGRLRVLNVAGNRLRALQLPEQSAYILHRLDISANRLDTLDWLRAFYALRELDASANPLADGGLTATTLQNMDALQTLRLRAVGLQRIEANAFRGLAALRELDLSGNRLTELDALPAFNGLERVERVWLSGNEFGRLDGAALRRTLPSLRAIAVSGNRWTCDELDEFVRSMEAGRIDVESEWQSVSNASVHGIRCTGAEDEPDADADARSDAIAVESGGDRLRWADAMFGVCFVLAVRFG